MILRQLSFTVSLQILISKNNLEVTMKPSIFVLSNTSIYRRGRQRLAPNKAGLFRYPKRETALLTCRGNVIMALPTCAERLVFDSGKGVALFLFPKLNIEHNANSHHTTATAPRRARRSTASSRTRSIRHQGNSHQGSGTSNSLRSRHCIPGIPGESPAGYRKGKSLTASTRDINHAPAVLRGGRA